MDIDWLLLERYIAGDCTREERACFDGWLAESPRHRQVVHEVREVVAQSRAAVEPAREEQILRDLKQQLQPSLGVVRVFPMPAAAPSRRRRWAGMAAAIALAVGGVAVYSMESRWSAFRSVDTYGWHVVTTAPGQRATFNLPDGSRVMLGVASTLKYSPAFERTRSVVLNGEAFFEVEHDDRRPFTVRAGRLVATDLGTEFMARAYAGDTGAQVAVRSGKVGVRAAETLGGTTVEHVVKPGQIGRLSSTGEPVVESADLDAQFAWTEGRLVFDGTPLADVAVELGRWFDVDFQLTDSTLGSRDLYGSFRNQSLTSVLNAIAPTLRLQWERHGRVIVIRSLKPIR